MKLDVIPSASYASNRVIWTCFMTASVCWAKYLTGGFCYFRTTMRSNYDNDFR